MEQTTTRWRGESTELGALTAVVSAIGKADFADAALDALNQPVQAASWSVYRVWPDREPVMHCSASRGVADTTHDCFSAYRAGLYRRDRSFDGVVQGQPLVVHMSAEAAPNRDHRDTIYRRHRILERLSVAHRESDGSVLAINLYRHEHQGPFSGVERDRVESMAPLILVSVERHVALQGPRPAPDTRTLLQAACPALTARELDVCERLLRGLTHDGIAADLGVSIATVKTYRARAFERLGLHFRSELFARFGGACRPLG